MKFLPKNLTRLYKLGIKTGVWYPKMYIWSLKMENFCSFYTKNEVFAQTFDPIVHIGDRNWSLVPQNVHLVPKNGKICTFYTKNEVFAQKFHPIVQIGDKNWSLVPQNVYLVPKNGKICTFYTKNEFYCPKI